MDDTLMVNFSSEPINSSKQKQKTTKTERIRKKRADRKLKRLAVVDESSHRGNHSTENKQDDSEAKLDVPSSNSKKRKREMTSNESEPNVKHAKFSSLFKHNPEIPEVARVETAKVTEQVFSSKSFAQLNLHPYMISNLKEKIGVAEMTNVQQESIPHILKGKDTLVKSQTGSGKTFAYAIPIVQQLQAHTPKIQRSDGPYAIVIVPTRELALQSVGAFDKLVRPFTWVVPGSIMGGEKRKSEKARLRKGINILVSTPGRLLDHVENTKTLSLSKVKFLVIDEADRLLDMGFEKEVKKIVEALKEKVKQLQTVLVSATLSAGVEQLAGMTLNNPAKVDLSDSPDNLAKPLLTSFKQKTDDKSTSDVFATPEGLRHHFVVVPHKLRLVSLIGFLIWKCKQANKGTKILVFISTQESVEFHYMLLDKCLSSFQLNYLKSFKLHGDMPQKERTEVFNEFRESKTGILLCTDVAARGLDLPHVRWIVQYNAPESATDYIHRAGRTARIGAQGQAVLFLSPSETQYCQVLQDMNISLQELKVDTLLKSLLLEATVLRREGKQVPNTLEEGATALQMTVEEYLQQNMEARTLARKAYQSFVRAYATYPSKLKHIFHIKHLHLGHLAKSFGLQDSPKHIGDIIHNHKGVYSKKLHKKNSEKGKKPKRKGRLDLISEYASGL